MHYYSLGFDYVIDDGCDDGGDGGDDRGSDDRGGEGGVFGLGVVVVVAVLVVVVVVVVVVFLIGLSTCVYQTYCSILIINYFNNIGSGGESGVNVLFGGVYRVGINQY